MPVVHFLVHLPWFSAVVLAAWVAAAAAFVQFVIQKRTEAKAVNAAVETECHRLYDVLKIHELWWAERIRLRETDQPLISFRHAVYSSQIEKVGTLRSQDIRSIVRFYGYIDFLNALQSTLKAYKEQGKSDEFDLRYHQALLSCITFARLPGKLSPKEKDDDFLAHYRLKLCDLKLALALRGKMSSSDVDNHVLGMADRLVVAAERENAPCGFDVQERAEFLAFKEALHGKAFDMLQSHCDALYQDAIVNVGYRIERVLQMTNSTPN